VTGASGQFARRGQVRALSALVILVAWGAGLTLLVRREYFQGRPQLLAEAALRLSPSVTFFSVEKNGKQLGFASTTIDTLTNGIDAIDYSVVDTPDSVDSPHTSRTSKRTVVRLSRGLSLVNFDVQVASSAAPVHAGGRPEGDSAMVFIRTSGAARADSQRVRVRGPVLFPAIIPIAISLADRPKVGHHYSFSTFDPVTMTPSTTSLTITAESLFTLSDSAKFDEDKGEWVTVLTDTVRAWRVESAAGTNGGTNGGTTWPPSWVDAQGRVVQRVLPDGSMLRRTAYEIAFENWRIARDRATASNATTGDILERTAVAAHANKGRSKLFSMSVLLGAPDLRGFDLDGGRQHFSGDTLTVSREKEAALTASPSLAALRVAEVRQPSLRGETNAEPLLQARDQTIVAQAIKIVGDERDPRLMLQKLNQWVFDSLAKVATFSVPSALAVLHARKGDANEHTQLFVALARALRLPARIASGLMYLNGKFYYHAWPEVWLGDWVAIDPTLGQFPADAAHLRFVVGGFTRQTELLQLMGNLKIKVLEAK
jgi:hypothetical protein